MSLNLWNNHTYNYINHLRQMYKGKKIGFIQGCFSNGNYSRIRKAKFHCDVLIVGLCTGFANPNQFPKIPLSERITNIHPIPNNIITWTTKSDLRKILRNLQPDVRFLPPNIHHFVGQRLNIPIVRL